MNPETTAETPALAMWSGFARWSSATASKRFVLTAILASFVATFALWQTGALEFTGWATNDGGAALRCDSLIASGKRAGVDFGYYYGLLPLLVFRAFASVVPNGVVAMLLCGGLASAVVAGAECVVALTVKPTRLGALVMACAVPHTMIVGLPTHALEAALLAAGVALVASGKRRAALTVVALSIFVKLSMAVVLLGVLGAIVLGDAIRERRLRPLRDLAGAAAVLVVTPVVLGLTLGFDSLVAVMNPRVGAAVYKASGFGFFTAEGRAFWWQHTIGWYLGTLAGIWLVGTLALVGLGARACLRIVRSLSAKAPAATAGDHVVVLALFGHLAFIAAFFPGNAYFTAHYYTWLLFLGLAPAMASAGTNPRWRRFAPLAWGAVAGLSLLGNKQLTLPKLKSLREPVAPIAGLTGAPDLIAQWEEVRAAAHRSGRVAALGRGAHLSMLDPTIAEGPYWMLLPGLSQPRAVDATVRMLGEADAVVVVRSDLKLLRDDPDPRLGEWLTGASPIFESTRFVVLRGGAAVGR